LQREQHLPISKDPAISTDNIFSSSPNAVIPSVLALSAIAFDLAFNNLESSLRDSVTFLSALLLVLKLTSPFLTHRALQIIG
ncbi:hypothetical protein PMAYCL1PPCAC_29012, partial [Pristionchus mayeri]